MRGTRRSAADRSRSLRDAGSASHCPPRSVERGQDELPEPLGSEVLGGGVDGREVGRRDPAVEVVRLDREAVAAERAAQSHTRPRPQLLREPGLIEPRRLDLAGAVGDPRLHEREPASRPAHVHSPHLAGDRHLLLGEHVGDPPLGDGPPRTGAAGARPGRATVRRPSRRASSRAQARRRPASRRLAQRLGPGRAARTRPVRRRRIPREAPAQLLTAPPSLWPSALAVADGGELDVELLDARAVDLDDAEPQPVADHLVARLRRAAELAEDEAGDRVVVLLGQLDAELLVEVVDRERAVDADRVVVDPLDASRRAGRTRPRSRRRSPRAGPRA